ncbi:MAG: hypothetical protein H7X77_04205, partial [Anaerolineae bacterium]|nr:hypothetical protein [Anaerolineae bacterium]
MTESKIMSSLNLTEPFHVLGYNQKQNGSVLQAGARALLIPSELTKALCSSQGRIAAQTIMLMGA